MDPLEYKAFHEEYMCNRNGTTVTETFIAFSPSFFTIYISTIMSLIIKVQKFTLQEKIHQFISDFVIIVIPPILCFTVLSDNINLMCVLLAFICIVALAYLIKSLGDVSLKDCARNLLDSEVSATQKPFITNFRAITNLLSVICILAVDFQVFPRRFAKTESFGFSLMDTGVGLFCVVNAIVSPEAFKKKPHTLFQSLKRCVPLIVLGGLRLFTTNQTNYQMHVTEYGVHWNFFITLATTHILSTIILSICDAKYSLVLSLVIICFHQCILWFGAQEWVLSDIPRDSFVNANREGITSSLGYVAIYIAGISIGHSVCNIQSWKEKIQVDFKLLITAGILWFLLISNGKYFVISRRLANIGYFFWLFTYSVTLVSLFLFFELLTDILKILALKKFKDNKKEMILESSVNYVPLILETVNYNGLPFFLLANLLTGIVNLSVQTLMLSSLLSVIIIICYMFVVCVTIFWLYSNGIKLKI